MIRVLLADDQAVVRDGLRVILEAAGDIEIVGEAEDGLAALELARTLAPDVVIMDIRMPRMNGVEATAGIVAARPGVRVLVLTTFGEDEHVYAALSAGASGFLLKDAERGELAAAVRIVAAGEQLLAPQVTRALIEHFVAHRPRRPVDMPGLAELTERETTVLHLMAQGRSNAEIATELFVSRGTVKTHVANVLRKLSVRDRVQAVVLAYRSGLAPAREPERSPFPGGASTPRSEAPG